MNLKNSKYILGFGFLILSFISINDCTCNSDKDDTELNSCLAGELRINGRCVTSVGQQCERGSDCISNICYAGKFCTMECSNDSECPAEYKCQDERALYNSWLCVFVGNTDGGFTTDVSKECVADDDCELNEECVSGHCIVTSEGSDGGTESECVVDSDCNEGERCLQNKCLSSEQSDWGEPCDPSWRDECVSPAVCASLSYTNGICATLCDVSHPCSPNQLCQSLPNGGYYCIASEISCFAPAYCAQGTVCAFTIGGASRRIVGICTNEDDTLIKTGDECDAETATCQTGICPEEGFCSQPCGSDGDCPTGFLCDEIHFSVSEQGIVKTLGCIPASTARPRFSEPCDPAKNNCRSGVCYSEGEGGAIPFCTTKCDSVDTGSCPYGYTCTAYGTDTICLPDVLKGDCGSDSDCGVGQVCLPIINREQNEVVVTCSTGSAGGETMGGACDYTGKTPKYCANGYCEFPGICGGLCDEPIDCPEGLICDYDFINRGDGTSVRIRRCVADPGSLSPCERDKDCPEGEMCGLWLSPRSTTPETRCTQKSPIGNAVGSQCAYSLDCQSLLCTKAGKCTSICKDSSDCPPDFFCGQVLIPLSSSLDSVEKGCVYNEGNTGELGAPCPNGAIECNVPLTCFADGQGTTFCTKKCTDATECQGSKAPECRALGSTGNYCQPEGYESPIP